jgi:hypothetical protein
MREQREAEAEQTWDANSSQGKIRGEILELRSYIKARNKRLDGKYMDTITKLLTTIHTQAPRIKKGIEGVGSCNFCKIVRRKEEQRTPGQRAGRRPDQTNKDEGKKVSQTNLLRENERAR